MSHFRYYAHKSVGQMYLKSFSYSQAVRVGDRIECAGQDGIPRRRSFTRRSNVQIAQAFANVDLNLKDAGGKGWEQKPNRWMPNHMPVWTCVGVSRLGEDDMRVEIEVVYP
ncbi:hypothetical protein CTA2_11904 [Colletotrichum tanaceti]|uniref:Uncharacterized protein n=1 Tax=Colletotrichum tanaceti TaxID=1306861 RepID=A0A4U6X6I3_9PEZI|nr:hypothetical protein CTA2_11904 [Colletotrichum tanaceti]TKW50489.1 hypothetical protein CTA1_1578 [Colletotrichum tanaceti]